MTLRFYSIVSLSASFFIPYVTELNAEDLIYEKLVANGDSLRGLDKDGTPVDIAVGNIKLLNWSGRELGLDAGGAAIWNGSSLKLFAANSWPFPDFVSGSLPNNRDGNPPENPILKGMVPLRLLESGSLAFFSQVDDTATAGTEAWNVIGSAGPVSVNQIVEPYYNLPRLVAMDGSAVLGESKSLEEGVLAWQFPDGSELPFPKEFGPAPGYGENSSYQGFNRHKLLSDRSLLVESDVLVDGSFLFKTFYLISPEAEFSVLVATGDALPPTEGLENTFFNLTAGADINDNKEIAFRALVVNEDSVSMGIGLFKAGPEDDYTPKLVALTNRVLPSDDSVPGVTFSNIANADVHIDEAGNVIFEAVLEGDSQSTVWRYFAETGKVGRAGPGVGEPVPGFSGSTTNSSWVMGMNSQGRLVIRIAGLDSDFLNLNGYFFEGPDGLFNPLAILSKPIVEGGGQVTWLEEPVLVSESNAVALVVRVDNIPTAYVVRVANELSPEGDTYIWDGGAGTSDWHTVAGSRSNWVDSVGVPWPQPPGSSGDEIVHIKDASLVELNQNVLIKQLYLDNCKLETSANIVFVDWIKGENRGKLAILSGTISSEGGIIETSASIGKIGLGNARISVTSFRLQDTNLFVEGGDLLLENNTSQFNSTFISVEDGSLTINDGVTYIFTGENPISDFWGDFNEVVLWVDIGTLDLRSREIFIEDACLAYAADEEASIFIGSAIDDPTSTIGIKNGKTRFPVAFNVRGKGTVVFRKPIAFDPASGQAQLEIYNSENTETVIDLVGSNVFPLGAINGDPNSILLINKGRLKLRNGGVTGALSNENAGEILILDQPNNSPIPFDCINYSKIVQNGDIEIQTRLNNSYDSLHIMNNSSTTFSDTFEFDEIRPFLNPRAILQAASGDSLIEFPIPDSNAPPALFGKTRIGQSASLTIVNLFSDYGFEIETIDQTSELFIQSGTIKSTTATGPGKVHISGDVSLERFPDSETTLKFLNAVVELENATFTATPPSDYAFHFQLAGPRGTYEEPFDKVSARFKDSAFKSNIELSINPDAELTIDRQFSIVAENQTTHNYNKIILGGDFWTNSIGVRYIPHTTSAQIETLPDLSGIQFRPTFDLGLSDIARVSVAGNTQLFLLDPGFIANGALGNARITIADNGSLVFPANLGEAINKIERNATLEIGKPDFLHSPIKGFPNHNGDLENFGTLILNDHELTFTGGEMINKGSLTLNGTSKIIGDMTMLRNDIQPSVQLAGNFNIEGSLETDALISMGASPGAGIVSGDLTLLPGAEIKVEFAGTELGTEFDTLEVGGTANLAGTLILSLIDEYTPEESDTLEFLRAGTVVGSFDAIDQLEMGRRIRMSIETSATAMTATPESISISTYADWVSYFFSEAEAADETISGPNANPDGDTLSNLLEYLLAGNPKQHDVQPYEFVLNDSLLESARLIWAKDVTDYDWTLQTSVDLVAWETLDYEIVESSQDSDRLSYDISITSSLTESDSRYYRFLVTQ